MKHLSLGAGELARRTTNSRGELLHNLAEVLDHSPELVIALNEYTRWRDTEIRRDAEPKTSVVRPTPPTLGQRIAQLFGKPRAR